MFFKKRVAAERLGTGLAVELPNHVREYFITPMWRSEIDSGTVTASDLMVEMYMLAAFCTLEAIRRALPPPLASRAAKGCIDEILRAWGNTCSQAERLWDERMNSYVQVLGHGPGASGLGLGLVLTDALYVENFFLRSETDTTAAALIMSTMDVISGFKVS